VTAPVFGALIGAAEKTPTLHIPSMRFAGGDQAFHVSEAKYTRMEKSFKSLGARSLLMASSDDTLILHQPPDPEYVALLRACGAGGTSHLIPSGSEGQCLAEDALMCSATLEFVRGWPGALEFYMVSDMDERLARQAGRPLPPYQAGVVSLFNDKVFFIRTLEDMGLPIIESYSGPSDAVAFRLTKDPGWPVVVRSSRSVGGAGVWVAHTATQRHELKKRIEKRRGEVFILQRWIDSVSSPNLQMYVGEDSICVLGMSTQVFRDGIRHVGNYFDGSGDDEVDGRIMAQGKALAMEAARMGYRGILGIDFIVTASGEIYAVEINARHNTSTHAMWFANRLMNADPFVASHGRAAYMRWPSPREGLCAMEWMKLLGEAAFRPDKGEGALPYDCGWNGLEAAIVASDPEKRQWLEKKAEQTAT